MTKRWNPAGRSRRLPALLAAMVVLAMLAAGCSGSDDADDAADTDGTSTTAGTKGGGTEEGADAAAAEQVRRTLTDRAEAALTDLEELLSAPLDAVEEALRAADVRLI